MKTTIDQLSKSVGEVVTLKGWVAKTRSSGRIKFVLLRDGTGFCQSVLSKGECSEKDFESFSDLTQESTIEVTGVVRKEDRSPGGYELGIHSLTILHTSNDYPITPKDHGIDFLMANRHLWLRSRKQHAALRVRSEIIAAIRYFFDEQGFTLLDTPLLTPNACEGTSTLFKTQYFDKAVFLSQSGQLYSEAGAAAFGKVYCFGPTFRAEKSKTRRHLMEFWMAEPEMAFYNLNDNMELAEQLIEYIVQRTLKNKESELSILERDIRPLEKVKTPFHRLHYEEAVKLIQKTNPDFKDGDDFGGADETIISSQYEKPVFIHRFPAALKAFYMKRDPNDEKMSLSCDLLATEGYGEIIGGSQREEDYDTLLKRIKEHHLREEDFKWYLDLRKYGTFEHSGFGLGLERTVAWICGLSHVRETIPFPRLYGRIYP